MSKQIFVKPKNPAIKVFFPDSFDFLPVGGALVKSHPYWRRRLRDGDVIIDDAPEASAPVATPDSIVNPEFEKAFEKDGE